MATIFCSPTDLISRRESDRLAALFSSARPPVWDATAQAVALLYCTKANSIVESYVTGHLADLTDADTLAQLKAYAVAIALFHRLVDKGHRGTANAFFDERQSIMAELEKLQRGEIKFGSAEQKTSLPYSTTSETTPTFLPDVDGTIPTFMENF